MPKIYKVSIELRHQGKTVLITPDKIEVPQYSIIQWNIIYFEPQHWDFDSFRSGLIYTIYFRKNSPFRWKSESLRIFGEPRPFQPFPETLTMKLAEGEAEKKGDFKYGISISEDGKDEPLYDEDPYIYVF